MNAKLTHDGDIFLQVFAEIAGLVSRGVRELK